MSSTAERMLISERMAIREKIDPAAVSACEKIREWVRGRTATDPFGAEQLGTLAANVTESTLYELTKGSDRIRGSEMSLDELNYAFVETPNYQSFVNLAVIVGIQEAMKAVVDTSRFYTGSD